MSAAHRELFAIEKKAIKRMYESGDVTSLLILYEDHGGSPCYIAYCLSLGLDIVKEYNNTCNDLNLNIDYGYEEYENEEDEERRYNNREDDNEEEEDIDMGRSAEEIQHGEILRTRYMEELVAEDLMKNCKTRDVLEIGGWYVPEEGQDEWSLPDLSWLCDLAPIETPRHDEIEMEIDNDEMNDAEIDVRPSTSSVRRKGLRSSVQPKSSGSDDETAENNPFTQEVAGTFFSKIELLKFLFL